MVVKKYNHILMKLYQEYFFPPLIIGIFIAYVILPIPTILYKEPSYFVNTISDNSKCYSYDSKEISCSK